MRPVPFIKSKKAAPCGDGLRRELALGSSWALIAQATPLALNQAVARCHPSSAALLT